ncbi:MAG: CPBP family intramembrane metalloprotease [Bdellovibrionaceae bacterium]|nr:CPBP family intramembrane metalloprotease [Pseudobdellovibrionaceae bacterium]MCB9093219.1 CPBP family intramembrane metalloprotease [Halobacteriovoraceae bacterium]
MNARKQIIFFLVCTFFLSWAYEAFIITSGGVKNFGILGLVALMWIPGLVSLIQRIFLKLGFADIGLHVGGRKFYFYAVIIPLVLSLGVNLLSELFDIRGFELISGEKLGRAIPLVGISLVLGIFGATGEELGWRGFLLPKMIEAKITKPYLMSGIIWALWHLPIVVFGGYYMHGSPLLIAIAYASSIIAMNFIVCDLRVLSGSIWVAIAFHSAHNFLFQLAVPNLLFTKSGSRIDLWEVVGADCGFLVAVLYVVAYLVFKRWVAHVRPS